MRSNRLRVMGPAASLAVAALFAGCSLTTDLSGFSTDTDAAPTSGEGGADAATDGTTVLPDAATEGGKPDAAGTFCVPGAHAFCEDFDTSTTLPALDGTQVDPKGAVSLSTARAASAPGALLSTMQRRVASDVHAQATLEKDFSGWRRTVLDFDVFVEAPGFVSNDVNSGIISLFFDSSTNGASFSLSVGVGYTTLGTPQTLLNSGALAYGSWQHAHFDIDPTGNVEGSVGAASWKGTFVPPAAGASPSTRIQLGVNGYNQPAPEFRVFYDNVTVDFP